MSLEGQIKRVVKRERLEDVLRRLQELTKEERKLIESRAVKTLRQIAIEERITHEGVRQRVSKVERKLCLTPADIDLRLFIDEIAKEIEQLSREKRRPLRARDRKLLLQRARLSLSLVLHTLKCRHKHQFFRFLRNSMIFGAPKPLSYDLTPLQIYSLRRYIDLMEKGCIRSVVPCRLLLFVLIFHDKMQAADAIARLVKAGANEAIVRRAYSRLARDLKIPRVKIPLLGGGKKLSAKAARQIARKIMSGQSAARAAAECGISYEALARKLKSLKSKKKQSKALIELLKLLNRRKSRVIK